MDNTETTKKTESSSLQTKVQQEVKEVIEIIDPRPRYEREGKRKPGRKPHKERKGFASSLLDHPKKEISASIPPFPQEIIDWLTGQKKVPPDIVIAALSDLNDKMTWAVCYELIQTLSRVAKLSHRLSEIDQYLCDRPLEWFEPQELLQLRKQLTSEIRDNLSFARKFINQNADSLKEINKEKGNVVDLMKSFSRDQLIELLNALSEK